MRYLNNFENFNEHIYTKALATHGSKWAENYKSLISHLKKQIEDRQLKDFKEDGDVVSFIINNRKYKIDKKAKLFLYKKEKGDEKEVELDLTEDQISSLIKALKKPLTSPKALDSTKKHPKGRKPYLQN